MLYDITIGQVSPTDSYHADCLLFPLWWTYFLISFQVLLWLFAITWIFFPQSTNGASKIKIIIIKKNIFISIKKVTCGWRWADKILSILNFCLQIVFFSLDSPFDNTYQPKKVTKRSQKWRIDGWIQNVLKREGVRFLDPRQRPTASGTHSGLFQA